MSLKTDINNAIKDAMRAKDQVTLRSLRAVKAAIQLAETDGSGNELDEASEIKILQKLVKQRQDSLKIYTEQNREDLAVKEKEELEVITNFLPKQLDQEELKSIVSKIIEETGAEGMRDMGRVMGLLSKEVAGRADGKMMSSIVKEMLG